MRVALYFGSFNPLHIGHIAICRFLLEGGETDQVRLVVSPQNPLKESTQNQSGFDRLKHAREVVAKMGNQIFVSDIEFSLPKPLYTIKTLRKFSELEPDNKFILIIGADNLAVIEKWNSWKELLEEYVVWVYPRSGFDGIELCKKYGVRLLDAPFIDVSSTQIRESEAEGEDLSSLKV